VRDDKQGLRTVELNELLWYTRNRMQNHRVKIIQKRKLSLQQAAEDHRVVRCRGSHMFWTIGSQMAVRLSALRAGRPLNRGRFLVLTSVKGWVDPRAIALMQGLCKVKIIKHNPTKTYGGIDVYVQGFLTSALVEGKRSASRPYCFTPGERAPDTHWIGDWVDPRAGLEYMDKWEVFILPGFDLNPLCRPARMQSLYRLRYRGSKIQWPNREWN
jgi:hypothetical protein